MHILSSPDDCLSQSDNPILTLLERYWREQRLWGTVPHRNRIDPTQIDMALPWTMMLENNTLGGATIRVAGQMLHQTLGTDPRGQSLDAFFDHRSGVSINAVVTRCFQHPSIIHAPLTMRAGLIRPAQRANMLLLPLGNDNGDVTRLLGAIVGLRPCNRPVTLTCDTNSPIRQIPLSERRNQKGPDAKHPTLRLVVNNS